MGVRRLNPNAIARDNIRKSMDGRRREDEWNQLVRIALASTPAGMSPDDAVERAQEIANKVMAE